VVDGRARPQYDIIAKLWMEQVDAKAVHKSSTMFLSVLPPGLMSCAILLSRF